jgi:hypothetical protein
MKVDLGRLQAQVKRVALRDWPRIIAERHRSTPLGGGFALSRFSSPNAAISSFGLESRRRRR